jgi:hypothetical protein
MKGLIRFFVGLVMIMGIAGGIDSSTDMELITLIGCAAVALMILVSGINAMRKENE